jgi:hypothetical protein
MGSITTEGHMPEEVRHMLSRSLARLPHRVIWKWTGNQSFPDKTPSNVKVVSWMPQQDLLGKYCSNSSMPNGNLYKNENFVKKKKKSKNCLSKNAKKLSNYAYCLK